MIDALVSADLLVDDVDAVAQRLVDVLGLPELSPAWIHDFPGYTYKAIFCRVNADLSLAPTLLEVVGPAAAHGTPPTGMPPVDRNLAAYAVAQGERPVKTHATVFATAAFPEIVRRLTDRQIRHRVEPPTRELPFERLWMGTTPEDPFGYDAAADGGLFVEVVPLQALRLPPPPDVVDVPDGTMVRIVRRRFLVEDLDHTLDTLRTAVGWPHEVEIEDNRDARSVVLQPNLPHSASLELSQPTDGRLAEYVSAYGPGPHAIRIGTVGVQAKVDGLRRRGTACTVVADGVVEVDPGALGGIVVELSELGE